MAAERKDDLAITRS